MLALGDVADVALDDIVAVYRVNVADKFHLDKMTVLGLERQVFVANIFFVLQCSKGIFASLNIPERTDFPELLIYKLVARVTQHVNQKRIDILNRSRMGI